MNTKLIRKETIAVGTMLFAFEKLEGFSFAAGQSIDLTLLSPKETDAEGNMRAYSLASSPEENELYIATRMRDTAFKRTLLDMPEGTEVSIEGPFGSFMLHENTSKVAVFLAGGIGITPFHSIIKSAAARKLEHKIILFYSNRRPEDAAFLSELQDLQKENPNYILVGTMTDMEKSAQTWEGERGYITGEMIQKYVPNGSDAIYYLAGPLAMVTAMRKVLTDSGVSNDDIRFEEFTGY